VRLFPRPEHLDWGLKELILSRDFYTLCKKRIEEKSGWQEGEENAVMTALLAEGAGEIVGKLEVLLDAIPPGRGRARSFFTVMAYWGQLTSIIATAFLEGRAFLRSPHDLETGITPSRFREDAQRLWALGSLLYPPNYLEEIAAAGPRVVFIAGSFPQEMLPAAMIAERLRPLLPEARFVLYQPHRKLSPSLPHVLEGVLRTPALFDVFDGIPIYTDLQDLTLCDVMESIAQGRSFVGLENLAYRQDGQVRFQKPSHETIKHYLDEVTLADPLACLIPDAEQEGALSGTEPEKHLFAFVDPVKQGCYWNRCHFCTSSRQSRIRRDPYLERRADETVRLLLDLNDHGATVTFVGLEVIPPELLHGMVARLESSGRAPLWGFEGKFEMFYTTEFIGRLSRTGCRGVVFGLETPSDRLNRLMDKHREGIDLAAIERMLDAFDEAGMAVRVNTIIDLPGATREEFDRHSEWLKKMFDNHRLFNFCTSSLLVDPGSRISRHPERYGLEILPSSTEDILISSLPYRRAPEDPMNRRTDNEIWESVFGTSHYLGQSINLLQDLYARGSYIILCDAAHNRNFFKEIREECRPLESVGNVRIRLAQTVEIAESDLEGPQGIWLADVGGFGGWVRLSPDIWGVLEVAQRQGVTVEAALAEKAPHASEAEKEKALRNVSHLVSTGFLQVS
jgi:hypothetical protein